MRLPWQTGLLLTTLFLLGLMPRQQAFSFQANLSGSDGYGQIISSANNLIVSGLPDSEAVRIDERNDNGDWDNRAEIVASEAVAGDGFGMAVAASDGLVVAGAPFSANGTGAVYVFERDDENNWQEITQLSASDATENANFGIALDASPDRIVVGTPGQGASGAAYVFTRDDTHWIEEAKLIPFDVTAQFGAAVAIEDDQIIIGAPQDNMGAGAAYVYLNTTGDWQVAAKLISADASDGDLFGAAVAISNSRMLVGAPQVDSDVEDAGAAYIFVRTRNAWAEETKLTGAVGQFGQAVALADNLALIGAPNANAVELFVLGEDGWQANTDLGATLSANPVSGAVAISGSTLSIGSQDSVQVYIIPGVTGELSLGTDNLIAGETLNIELVDPELNQQPNQVESITLLVTTSANEQEILTLTETDSDSGVFSGSIQSLAATTPRPQDNILDVQSGDTIIVTYTDARTETGSIITLQAEARVSVPTQSPMPTTTLVPTATITLTNTQTATPQPSATLTDIPSSTPSPTNLSTQTPTVTSTATATLIPSVTHTPTPTNGSTGILSVQPEFIQPGAAIVIALEDNDLNLDPQTIENTSVRVVSSNGETETLTLTETSMDTGAFTTIVETVADTAVPNDGVLNIMPGDILTFTYEDGQTATNESAQVTLTRRVVADFYIAQFVLVDSSTNEDLLTITDGMVIDLAQLPTRRLSIRAETQPAEVGSVVFELNNGLLFKVENRAPYALAGDNPIGGLPVGDYNPVDALIVGQHRLMAIPYSDENAAGTQGTGLTVEFSIVDSAAS